MRDSIPLMLPKLFAERKSPKSSFEMSSDPASSVHSNADSGFYSASECSTPPTPSFYRGHLRFPSSTSDLSSSPPTHDPIDALSTSGKLPKLVEDPIERDDDFASSPSHHYTRGVISTDDYRIEEAYDEFEHYCPGSTSKRRRSVESSAQSVTNRLERSFPSLRKVRERKRASTLSKPSRSTTPSRAPSTRTSSMTSSIHQFQSHDFPDKLASSLASARNSKEQLPESIASSPIDIAKANAWDWDLEEVESERYATTPLLPPMLVMARLDDVPTQSPLQSPTVAMADPMQSLATTPVDSPPVRAYPTPPLSTKPSIASFRAARYSPLVPSAEIPPIMLTNPNDKWALTLGHDNFTIHPEPYMPDVCDAASLKQLFANWEQARCNFTKHQVRMAEHNGPTSKVYQLCEQKWTEIDALWKKNHDLAFSRVTAIGEEPEPCSPLEPAPLSKMPTLNDPKSKGKFPKLGDEDIVGPMVQFASPIIQSTPPRKRAFFKFLSDFKFPASFLGMKSAGVRDQ